MKKIAAILAVVMAWLCLFSGAYAPALPPKAPAISAESHQEEILKARLEHMLNINFAYGEALENPADLMQEAALALADKAVADESGFMFVENSLLEGFIFNLYGAAIPAAACEYVELPEMAGHTIILPRGGVDMSHSIVEIYPEEYGVLRVVSCAEIAPHDGEPYTALAVTRFAPCSASSFGWVIISAEIME